MQGRMRGKPGPNRNIPVREALSSQTQPSLRDLGQVKIRFGGQWSSDLRLRERPITFVNSGNFDSNKLVEATDNAEASNADEMSDPVVNTKRLPSTIEDVFTCGSAVVKRRNIPDETAETASLSDSDGGIEIVQSSEDHSLSLGPLQTDNVREQIGTDSFATVGPTGDTTEEAPEEGPEDDEEDNKYEALFDYNTRETEDAVLQDYINNMQEMEEFALWQAQGTPHSNLPFEGETKETLNYASTSSSKNGGGNYKARNPTINASFKSLQIPEKTDDARKVHEGRSAESSEEGPQEDENSVIKDEHRFSNGARGDMGSENELPDYMSDLLDATEALAPFGKKSDVDPVLSIEDEWEMSLSLKSKRKRVKKHDFDLQLSDSELERCLRNQYQKDRLKKAAYKRAREEARAEGLLNGKKGHKKGAKKGITSKNDGNHTVFDVVPMIRAFLHSKEERLALPPMESSQRRSLHGMAIAFRLHSKSTGKGDDRYTVLTKTKLSADARDEDLSRAANRFIGPRAHKSNFVKESRISVKRGGGGAGKVAASYRDGDVVGAAAPELGSENRGHAMMQKMGWSSGKALGIIGNEGILHPVTHIVKTTKAGLG